MYIYCANPPPHLLTRGSTYIGVICIGRYLCYSTGTAGQIVQVKQARRMSSPPMPLYKPPSFKRSACNVSAYTGQTCGPAAHYACCSVGNCCSVYGFCGDQSIHCGKGCQPGFGDCSLTGEQHVDKVCVDMQLCLRQKGISNLLCKR